MSFMVFQLVFAVIALALVVVAGLIVRQIVRKGRNAPKAPREAQPKAAALRMPSLGRKAAKPEPEPDTPAPARRRQLHSFAEAERSAAEAEAVVLPVPASEPEAAEPVAYEAQPPAASERRYETAPETGQDIQLEAEGMTEQALDYSEAVLGRLEEAFEDLQDEDITLGDYRERVLAELAAVEHRIAALQLHGASADLDAALVARDSVRWCLDWADDQASLQQG